MKFFRVVFLTLMALLLMAGLSNGLPSIDGKVFGLYPLTNEVSFLKNVDDSGIDWGLTVQVIAINGFKLWTDFTLEFTADFNWDMSYENNDHYIELSLVKPVIKSVSLNYQRIFSTFENKPINQFGIRFSF
jgi:hypothetical protein